MGTWAERVGGADGMATGESGGNSERATADGADEQLTERVCEHGAACSGPANKRRHRADLRQISARADRSQCCKSALPAMAHVLLLPLQAARRTDSLAIHPARQSILLRGFQLYAVEKWLVDRSRLLTHLTVYTGLHYHVLPVAAYTPIDSSSWDNIISFLKRDGARQRLTEHGTIMVTSLAHFRSDYTIVHIPDGDFPAVSDYLYANINLLRMNCSGRSALTLEEPRYMRLYSLPSFADISIATPPRIVSSQLTSFQIRILGRGIVISLPPPFLNLSNSSKLASPFSACILARWMVSFAIQQ